MTAEHRKFLKPAMFRRCWAFLGSLLGGQQRRRQLWYAPLLGLALAIMMGRLVWLAGSLPVQTFAALAFGLLLSSALGIVGAMGLQPLLQRDLPGLLIRGQEAVARRLLMQAVLLSIACFLVLLPAAFIGPAFSAYPHEVWAAGLLHGLAYQLFLLATTDSRSRGDPLTFALDNFYRAVLVAIASCLVASNGGSAVALLMAEAGVSIILSARTLVGIFLRDKLSISFQIQYAIKGISGLPWSNALFLLSASILTYGLLNIDRWVASFWLSASAFAQYAFVAIGLAIAQSMQSLLNAAAFPMVGRRHASQGNESAFRLARNLSWTCLAMGAISAPIVVVAAPLIIEVWFPQYVSAIPLIWPMLFVAILRLSDFHSTYLLVAGHERALTCVNIVILLCTVVILILLNSRAIPLGVTPLQAVVYLALCVGVGHYIAVMITASCLRLIAKP